MPLISYFDYRQCWEPLVSLTGGGSLIARAATQLTYVKSPQI